MLLVSLTFQVKFYIRIKQYNSCRIFNSILRFLSLRVFGLLSSSLLLFPQRFGQYILLLQVFVELGNLHRTTNYVLYGFHGILNTCTRLWLTESEQATPEDSIKDVVRSSVKVLEFDKHLKKAGGYIKRCGNNNKDEDNSLKTLNDKNQQASSQKFRQLISILRLYTNQINIKLR